MIGMIWRALFGGCEHKWKTMKREEWVQGWGASTHKREFTRFEQECERCGKVQVREL